VLEHERSGPPLEGAANQRRVVDRGEHHHGHARVALAQLLENREAVHPGHPHVQQDDVGAGLADERHDLVAGVGFSDEQDVVLAVEDRANRVEHQAMVVHRQDLEAPHVPQSPLLFGLAEPVLPRHAPYGRWSHGTRPRRVI